jgi:hypothetical protein
VDRQQARADEPERVGRTVGPDHVGHGKEGDVPVLAGSPGDGEVDERARADRPNLFDAAIEP